MHRQSSNNVLVLSSDRRLTFDIATLVNLLEKERLRYRAEEIERHEQVLKVCEPARKCIFRRFT